MDMLSKNIVRARKPHLCYNCGAEIAPGQKFMLTVACDGKIWIWKDHLDCAIAVSEYHKLCNLNYDEGVCLKEDLTEEDTLWIAEKFPGVSMRLGFVVTPFC